MTPMLPEGYRLSETLKRDASGGTQRHDDPRRGMPHGEEDKSDEGEGEVAEVQDCGCKDRGAAAENTSTAARRAWRPARSAGRGTHPRKAARRERAGDPAGTPPPEQWQRRSRRSAPAAPPLPDRRQT